ncbi:MAG: lipopolysaccharide assembly protein LapB [Gammaproteobacteria bacterium]
MWELLWLLLPVAAVSGWWVAKRDNEYRAHYKTPGLSSHYFKGLNYLLNEQPDKAIEVFLKMLEVDSETAETHLALGNLFRRRGEVDRAIRIHQNLIARPTLSRPLRTLALLELGQDYMRAGLFDRAETLFLELIEMNDHTAPALRHLIDIYQQEKEWDKAIAVTKRWEEVTGKSCSEVIAHYYCELAEQSRQQSDLDQAMRMIERALEFDRNCVRASLLQGDMEVEAGDCKAAIRSFKRVEQQDPDYLPEIIEPLLDCYHKLGQTSEIIDYLKQILVKHSSISLILALAELLRQQAGDDAAANFITEQLRKRPSVRGLDRLIELNLAHSEGAARDNLLILRDLVKKLLEEKPVYKCNHCGFVGKLLHWQCPSCKTWNSMKPIHGVEGE